MRNQPFFVNMMNSGKSFAMLRKLKKLLETSTRKNPKEIGQVTEIFSIFELFYWCFLLPRPIRILEFVELEVVVDDREDIDLKRMELLDSKNKMVEYTKRARKYEISCILYTWK